MSGADLPPAPADLTPRPPSLAGKGAPNSTVVDQSSPVPAREGGRGVRSAFLCLLLAVAILTPGIATRGTWPGARVEQALALVAVVWLVTDWWRAGRPLRPA